MNDANFETRLAKLERAARWYRVGFFAVCVLAVGMGAKFAVVDAEFGVVKAKRFNVIGEGGQVVAEMYSTKSEATNKDEGFLVVASEDKKKATFVRAGVGELKYLDESDK
jgi:Na+/H+ antiporter NhaA